MDLSKVAPQDRPPEVSAEKANPANKAVARAYAERQVLRNEFEDAEQRLQLDPIDGLYIHWFREGRVRSMEAKGWIKLQPDECFVNRAPLSEDRTEGGNTDLGNCVSVVGGEGGERLIAMAIREDWWIEIKAKRDLKNAQRMRGIFGGENVGISREGKVDGRPDQSYVKQAASSMPVLNRGMPKAQRVRGGRSNVRGEALD